MYHGTIYRGTLWMYNIPWMYVSFTMYHGTIYCGTLWIYHGTIYCDTFWMYHSRIYCGILEHKFPYGLLPCSTVQSEDMQEVYLPSIMVYCYSSWTFQLSPDQNLPVASIQTRDLDSIFSCISPIKKSSNGVHYKTICSIKTFWNNCLFSSTIKVCSLKGV